MRYALVVAILSLTVFSTAARAENTGNNLLESCQKAVRFFDNNGGPSDDVFQAGWCFGWVSSILEHSQMSIQWRGVTKSDDTFLEFCLPTEGIPVIQGVRVLVKYLQDHPEQLHENAMGLTIAAFKNSFPCQRSK